MQTESERPSAYAFEWGTWTRRVATIAALLALVVVGVLLFRHALVYIAFSLVLAYLLYYPVRLLARRTRLSYGLSVGLVFVAYLALLILLLVVAIPPLIEGLSDLVAQVGPGIERSGNALLNYAPGQSRADLLLRPLSRLAKAKLAPADVQPLAENMTQTLNAVVEGVTAIAGAVLTLLTIHVFALFALLETPRLYHAATDRLSGEPRREFAVLTLRLVQKWHRVFWASLLFGVLVGGLNAVQMTLLGIPAALIVGLITGVLALIPVIGPFINIFVIAGAALAQGSTTLPIDPLALALLTVAINLVIVAILAEVVFPKIVGEAVSLPVIVIIPAVIVSGALGGALGMIFIGPILGFALELAQYVLKKIHGGDPYPGEPEPRLFEGLISP